MASTRNMSWFCYLLIFLFFVSFTRALDVRDGCITRPQFTTPVGIRPVPTAREDSSSLSTRRAVGNEYGSNIAPNMDTYQGCWLPMSTCNRDPCINNTARRFSEETMYGHPRYCQERRHNIFAQPQYGDSPLSARGSNYYWPQNQSRPDGNLGTTSTWQFKGFYYYGAPGRIGLRDGNPGYFMTPSTRMAISNGHTAYIQDLAKRGLYNAGEYPCSSTNIYTSSCYGWDIDRSNGVWTECVGVNRSTAYAIFIGASTLGTSEQLNVFKGINQATRWDPSTNLADILLHNCTSCTGKMNLHTRGNLSSIDEGPLDSRQDPYNPWSFTISLTYPTYLDTSSFNETAYAYSQQGYITAQGTLVNGQQKGYLDSQYRTMHTLSLGYSVSNVGGIVNGRYDLLTARGVHLHHPPENWGASFEPTRALGPPSPGWAVDAIRNWTKNKIDLDKAWRGLVAFVMENVTMPDVDTVPSAFRNKSYLRYKAPHVSNQPSCTQLAAKLPGDPVDQEVFGCSANCSNGCVENYPSLHNPGPSFANESHSVNLVRIHKATVHFSCVRALIILQQQRLDDAVLNQKARHTYAFARVLMRPQPGNGFLQKTVFRNNVENGAYIQNATGYWRFWQTGTVGLRSMDVGSSGPSPASLRFRGVTDNDMRDMPRQLKCWDC